MRLETGAERQSLQKRGREGSGCVGLLHALGTVRLSLPDALTNQHATSPGEPVLMKLS